MTAVALVVRDAVEADVPELTAIYNHYIATSPATFDIEPFSVEQRERDWFPQYSATGRYRLLVATDGSRVLGYATSSPFQSRAAYETTVATAIYCAPDNLGRGAGSLLYGALFRAIAGENLHRAMAGITLPNEASVRLHHKFGFTDIGIEHEVGRKFDRYWDVLILERPLPYEPA